MTFPFVRPTVLVLGALCWASVAVAQQEPGDTIAALKRLSVEQLMSIEVSSVSKRPEVLSQAASAIQVISQEDIRRSGARSLPEALRLAVNLQVAQIDSRQWAISARGFNGSIANKLLVLIDGRIIYTPLYSGVFWDVQDVMLADVDRIEVISGPGATLWGANAVNGVINVITKNTIDTQGAFVSGGSGSDMDGFGIVRYGGRLAPSVHYRLYGKGFARDPAALPTGQRASDRWHFGQGGLRVDWDVNDSHRVTLHGDLYGGQIGQPGSDDVDVSGRNVIARWSHTHSPTSSVSAQLYYDGTHRDIPGVLGQDLHLYDFELQYSSRLGTRHDVIWGLGYRLMNDHVHNTPGLAFLPAHVSRDWISAFLQDEIAIVPDQLILALGTKIEHNDYSGIEVQPSARVAWRPGPDGTLWAAVSRAVRTPSRIDRELFLPGMPPYTIAGGPDFDSEELLAYELGYRHQRGRFALSTATFYNRYDGLRSLEQANPPDPVPLVIGNGHDAESYGAELTLDYGLTDAWRVRLGYTELRVHFSTRAGSTDQSGGESESLAPDRQLFLHSTLDVSPRVTLDGQLRYVGRIEGNQVPDYAELNARLAWYPTANLGVSLVGQNLLHDRHAEIGAPAIRLEIERSVYGAVEWRF